MRRRTWVRTHLAILACSLWFACSSPSPQAPTATPSPTASTAAGEGLSGTHRFEDGDFGWFEVSVAGDQVSVKWPDGQLTYTLSKETRQKARQLEASELEAFLESLVPRKPGAQPEFALGELQFSDLEGGFFQLDYGEEQKLVLVGEITKEHLGAQVLLEGRLTNEAGIGMTGPTFEVEKLHLWH